MYIVLVNILMDFTEAMVLSLKPSDRVVHDSHWHPAIFKKIEKRDAEGARRVFHEHLQEIVPTLIELEKTKPGIVFH